MTAPPLDERKRPGLSATLTGPRNPMQCQCCAATQDLARWQECDEWDQRTPVVVNLCAHCSKREIDRHARLYHLLDRHEPWPGNMAVCVGCAFNSGTRCTHERAKQNGGPGVELTQSRPSVVHICAGRRSGFRRMWAHPVSACAQRAEVDREYT